MKDQTGLSISIFGAASAVLPLNNIQGSSSGSLRVMPPVGILPGSSRVMPFEGIFSGSSRVMPLRNIHPSSLRVMPFEGIHSGSSKVLPLNSDQNIVCIPTFLCTNIQSEILLGSALTYHQITSLISSTAYPPVICQYSTADIFPHSVLAAQKVYATVSCLSSIFCSILELLWKCLFLNLDFMLMWVCFSTKSRNTIQLVQLSMWRHLYLQHDFIAAIKDVMHNNLSLYVKAQIMLCCAHPCLSLILIIAKLLLRKKQKPEGCDCTYFDSSAGLL